MTMMTAAASVATTMTSNDDDKGGLRHSTLPLGMFFCSFFHSTNKFSIQIDYPYDDGVVS